MLDSNGRKRLYSLIRKHFSLEDIHNELCFDLDIEYENIPGNTKDTKVRELIEYCDRRGNLILELIDRCTRVRPNVNGWDKIKPAGASPNFIEFVVIPEGEFLMGSNHQTDPYARENERPQHKVFVSQYKISTTPITNRQYAVFVKEQGHQAPEHWQNGAVPPGRYDHPVVNVSWHDAGIFVKWYGEKQHVSCRLPTEAEWEKAARGTDNNLYPWGDKWNHKKLNCLEGGLDRTCSVGKFFYEGSSPYSVADMCGNTWEWCFDWYAEDIYENRKANYNPLGPPKGTYRSVRGSTFKHPRKMSRAACRLGLLPETLLPTLGFRCVIENV